MSRTENHFGVMREICDTERGFEAKYALAISKYDLTPDEDDEPGYIVDPNFYYHERLKKMFLLEAEENEYGHTAMVGVGKNKFVFCASFYNGGGCLSEVLESMLDEVYPEGDA